MALVQAGYQKDALDASEKAVLFGAEEPQAWYARGHVLRVTGDAAGAEPAFEKAVEIDPSLAVAWHELGMVRVDTGNLASAKIAFEKVLDIAPLDEAAAQAIAIVEARMEEG
jgi:tetratricopeptide (TPR) repeat protein